MKKILFLLTSFFLLGNCSDNSSNTSSNPNTEYDIDNVRILFPKAYQKITSATEINNTFFDGKDTLDLTNQFLLDKFLALGKNQNHWFAKLENKKLGFITLKTNGPVLILNKENTDYLLGQYEALLERIFQKNNPNYTFRKIDEKLKGAHRVKFLKFKYAHSHDDLEWFSTNYLIYSNNRTIEVSIFSLDKEHLDLENFMQFIEIKKVE